MQRKRDLILAAAGEVRAIASIAGIHCVCRGHFRDGVDCASVISEDQGVTAGVHLSVTIRAPGRGLQNGTK